MGGKYTRFMYDGMNIIGELCEGDYYIYHRGTELIGYQSYNGKSYYYRQDSHGNVTALLDFSGSEVKNYKYDAYGEPQGTRLNPAGDQTIIYQWKAETEKVYNSFGFCGEYADVESGLIYLRARMYDPSTGRFINEDPVKDGLNWYVYCENNPVMFVDPWGTYYVKEDYKYCMCGDPRCSSFKTKTGTYTLVKDNWFTAIGRTVVGEFVPGGGIINYAIESLCGVVDGRSKTEIGSIGSNILIGALSNSDKQLLKAVGKSLGAVGTVLTTVENSDIATMDSIAFSLMSRNNMSLTFSSQKEAKEIIEGIYSFIYDNNFYFSSQIDGSRTLYQLDTAISKSKDPGKTIDWYATNYINGLKRSMGIPTNYLAIKSQYKKLLNGYEDRLNQMDAFVNSLRED